MPPPVPTVNWPNLTSLNAGAGLINPVFPDPIQSAKAEAARLDANRTGLLDAILNRAVVFSPWVDKRELRQRAAKYYREMMARTPAATRYPEAAPWVDYVRAVDQEVKRLVNLTEEELAILRCLGAYLRFRGYREIGVRQPPAPAVEKCRVAFLPDTDRGPMYIKNVDDPLTNWQPRPPLAPRAPRSEYFWDHVNWVVDGTGSGLHLDDEPAEIFPLPVLAMASFHAADTPSVVEFLRRYSPFWGSANYLVIDKQFRVQAIEKCSHNFFETFGPDPAGFHHISGMVCRDPRSPQGQYQQARREEYLRLNRMPSDCPDACVWRFGHRLEEMLVEKLHSLGRCPRAEDVLRFFRTTYPDGLCKDGAKSHPDQILAAYTLSTRALFFRDRHYYRWQLSPDGKSRPPQPEICRFD